MDKGACKDGKELLSRGIDQPSCIPKSSNMPHSWNTDSLKTSEAKLRNLTATDVHLRKYLKAKLCMLEQGAQLSSYGTGSVLENPQQ